MVPAATSRLVRGSGRRRSGALCAAGGWRYQGVHGAWRLTAPGKTPPSALEWAFLDRNLYFAEGFPPVVVDPRVFSVEDDTFGSLTDYLVVVQPFEAGSVAIDPDLSDDLLPLDPRASRFGAR